MEKTSDLAELFCAKCGAELTDQNTHESTGSTGLSLYCTKCEEKTYSSFEQANGAHMALYLNCARYDVPCEPTCVPEDFGTEAFEKKVKKPWAFYLSCVKEMEKYKSGKKPFEFSKGVTSLLHIFGKNLDQKTFAMFVRNERARASEKGTEEQIERWGKKQLLQNLPMSAEIYNELDRQYNNRIQSYNGQTITPTMQDTLIKVCKWNVCIDFLVSNGEMQAAKQLTEMVEKNLASEQMRKSDEKPVENFRPDAWIAAFKKKGYMDEKGFVTKERILEIIILELRRKKYPVSVDAIHQLLLNIINNARKNADLPSFTILPEEYRIKDTSEFENTETEAEKAAKKDCGLTKVQFAKNGEE